MTANPHPLYRFTTPAGAVNRAAIAQFARTTAQQTQTRFYDGQILPRYRDAFHQALSVAFDFVRGEIAARALSADEIARREDRVSRLFEAAMIDETARSLAISDAIRKGA